MYTRLAVSGSQVSACWSTWKLDELRRQLAPASRVSSIGTPATKACDWLAGSTQIRPNHQPKVDCDADRNEVLVIAVHVSPPLVDVQKLRKSPLVLAAMA